MELFMLYTSNHNILQNARHEVLSQLSKFDIRISAIGFFSVDRQFLTAVSISQK